MMQMEELVAKWRSREASTKKLLKNCGDLGVCRARILTLEIQLREHAQAAFASGAVEKGLKESL